LSSPGYIIALVITCVVVGLIHIFGFKSRRQAIRIRRGQIISPKKSYEIHAWCTNKDARGFIPNRLAKYGYEVFMVTPSYDRPGDFTFAVRGPSLKKLMRLLNEDADVEVV
jgi:hypothetical protein